MTMQIIDTPKKFKQWIDENNWFADANVPIISPIPKVEKRALPSSVTMELAYQIEGGYKAHSTSVSSVWRLVANDIHAFHLLGTGTYNPEHCSEGIEILDSDNGVAFQMTVPSMLILRCGVIAVEQRPNLVETIRPYLSDQEVSAKIPSMNKLTPAQWVTLFERHGQNVVWHTHQGEPSPISKVPESNYDGWFLQLPEDLDKGQQGIFFYSCRSDGDGLRMQLQNKEASEVLWHTLMLILGQFKDIHVYCGNCEFQRSEWLEQLNSRDKV